MLKSVLLVAAVVIGMAIAALLIHGGFNADTFHLSRSASMAAPPETVFALVNDLRRFNAWNPAARRPCACQKPFVPKG